MRLPVDTAAMTFVVMAAPEPVVDFATRQPKADATGQPLSTIQVAAMFEDQGEILAVKVAGPPPAVELGARVQLGGLVATPWAMGDRSGIAYRAASFRPLAEPKPAERPARVAAS